MRIFYTIPMKSILTYLILLFSVCSFSQNTTISILDFKTNEPVSFAKVSIGDNYILSNYSGQFQLDSNHFKVDSLKVSCIGYETRSFSISEIKKDSILKLIPDFRYLKEVEVTSKKVKYKNTKIGVVDEPDNMFFTSIIRGRTGEVKAVWIPNDRALKGKIQTINVYVSDMGFSSSYFRVHVYDCNPINIKPGKELLIKNVIAQGTEGNQWVSVDVKEMNISVSESGFFVGIEWLPETKNESFSDTLIFSGNRYDTTYTLIYKGNGVALGCVHQKYSISKNKNWYLDSLTSDWKLLLPVDESRFFITDTLQNGRIYTPTPENHVKEVPCINADIRYIKQKKDKTYTSGKKRKLNKIEKVEENLFLYPQNSIENLFSSLIKAFQNNDVVYVLKYLCVYKDDKFKSIYTDIKNKEIEELITEENKNEILEHLTFILKSLSNSTLIDKGNFCYDLIVSDTVYYNLFFDNGLWKINPYSYKVIK